MFMSNEQENVDRPSATAFYDAEIAPLMAQVIVKCKAAGIPFFATFELPGPLLCSTAIHRGPAMVGRPRTRRSRFGSCALVHRLHQQARGHNALLGCCSAPTDDGDELIVAVVHAPAEEERLDA